MSEKEAIEILNDMLGNDTESLTQDQFDAVCVSLRVLKDAQHSVQRMGLLRWLKWRVDVMYARYLWWRA